MNKTLIAVPTAALIGMSTLGVATATSASAAPVETSVSTASVVPAKSKAARKRANIRKKARIAKVKRKYVKRYKITFKQARQIRASKRWAKGWKPRAVRRCESGGNYRINTGNGYYGAYQFAAGTWRGIGGGRYARYAHQAPKFAQDHMAYRLWKRAGWGPWGCA